MAGNATGSFDSVSVGTSATLDATIQINTGDFVPGVNDPDLLFLVALAITGQLDRVDSDDYSVVEADTGLALRVVPAELAEAQALSTGRERQGQIVAEDLQIDIVSSDEPASDLDELFASDIEFGFLN